ncbi:MAG: DNA polymerase III subunit epsilon [Alphaproteobacteria bacterium]|nr:DNA polymerase III subunit epsilon [Alphaproteobacteria bacterium]
MREVVLDTETTGLEPAEGHRVIEIGAVELVDHIPTGNTFQAYLNPERLVPIESQRVHGISDEFLADKPLFADVCDEMLAFLGDAPLVIHNAAFDIKFINAELSRVARAPIPIARAIDTIDIAKAKLPGARYSLDELCKRFGIDLSGRAKHGALLDAELTARVYLELLGGRQTNLSLGARDTMVVLDVAKRTPRLRPAPLAPRITPEEEAAHAAFIAKELGDEPVWNWKAR